ncbi:helix-turn-helix transcriptional regulator [Methylomicrobium lacus]|uniref:helix-turn-helix transcriptional regulator n=1 Tax=Methylomicrobium lacus TaxID=136992 RepID=UPI0004BBE6E0|nr:helix-turn-helix domain-containing protein [Methylomicrobium lacus]
MGAHITNTSPMILRPNAAAQTLGVSIATFWRIVKRGDLRTVKITERSTGVLQADLEAYIAQRISSNTAA